MIFIRSRNKPQEYGLPFQLHDRRVGHYPQPYRPNDRVFVRYWLDPNRHRWIENRRQEGFTYTIHTDLYDPQRPERTAELEVAFRVVECQHWFTADGEEAATLHPVKDQTILEAETDSGEEVFLRMLKEVDPDWFEG